MRCVGFYIFAAIFFDKRSIFCQTVINGMSNVDSFAKACNSSHVICLDCNFATFYASLSIEGDDIISFDDYGNFVVRNKKEFDNNIVEQLVLDKAGIKNINTYAFKNFQKLSDLSLDDNDLHVVPALFDDTSRVLKSLQLNGNTIKNLEQMLCNNHVKVVEIRKNSIRHVLDLGCQSQTTVLDLSYNHIEDINLGFMVFEGTSALSWLDLSHNQIADIAAAGPNVSANLSTLYLNNNRLQNLTAHTLASLSHLHTLDLSANALTSITADAFNNLVSLTKLNLAENALFELPDSLFHNTAQIASLDLGHNRLNSLSAWLIAPLFQLEQLNITHNQLSASLEPSLSQLHNLTLLDLSYNRLTDFDLDKFVLPHNSKLRVRLDGNFLSCSCWLRMIRSGRLDNHKQTRYFNVTNLRGAPCSLMPFNASAVSDGPDGFGEFLQQIGRIDTMTALRGATAQSALPIMSIDVTTEQSGREVRVREAVIDVSQRVVATTTVPIVEKNYASMTYFLSTLVALLTVIIFVLCVYLVIFYKITQNRSPDTTMMELN